MQALSKERVPVLNIIAAQGDNITWWNFTSWCRGGATHDHDHELITQPKNVLAWYSFLIGDGKWKYILKRMSSFRHLNWWQNILFYDKSFIILGTEKVYNIGHVAASKARNESFKRTVELSNGKHLSFKKIRKCKKKKKIETLSCGCYSNGLFCKTIAIVNNTSI